MAAELGRYITLVPCPVFMHDHDTSYMGYDRFKRV